MVSGTSQAQSTAHRGGHTSVQRACWAGWPCAPRPIHRPVCAPNCTTQYLAHRGRPGLQLQEAQLLSLAGKGGHVLHHEVALLAQNHVGRQETGVHSNLEGRKVNETYETWLLS